MWVIIGRYKYLDIFIIFITLITLITLITFITLITTRLRFVDLVTMEINRSKWTKNAFFLLFLCCLTFFFSLFLFSFSFKWMRSRDWLVDWLTDWQLEPFWWPFSHTHGCFFAGESYLKGCCARFGLALSRHEIFS